MPYLENMGLILADFNNQENLIKKIYIFLFIINSLEGSCRHSLSSTYTRSTTGAPNSRRRTASSAARMRNRSATNPDK